MNNDKKFSFKFLVEISNVRS